MAIHQPTCRTLSQHVERDLADLPPGVPDLEWFAGQTRDDYRAELLGLDPTFYEVVKRLRAETIFTEGAEA